MLRIVVVGDVNHGKSTLIGRLLHEAGSLMEGKIEQLQTIIAKRRVPFEWSYVLETLQVRRDQNICNDISQVCFGTKRHRFVLTEAPSHTEFCNGIPGAAQADAAILVVDAVEGVGEQTRRQVYWLKQLLGIQQLIVVVNKMDCVAYDAGRFRMIETELTEYLAGIGLSPIAVIPVSVRDGVGITEHTYTFEWFRPTLVDALNRLTLSVATPHEVARLPLALDFATQI